MVECRAYLWKANKPDFNLASLRTLENDSGIQLAPEFIAYMRENFGDKPIKSVFAVGRGNAVASHFLHFQTECQEHGLSLYSVQEQKEDIEEYIDDKIIPFLITVDSNLVCLDYRTDGETPKVILIVSGEIEDGERAIRHLANNFSQFLANLTDE